jgi:2-oxo-4-hydroxy-4-carboxy-5-ureidoimidazoline decarboxylase
MSIENLNQASTQQFLALIGGPLEGETWLAARVAPQRPFENVDTLYSAFKDVMDNASEAEKISLISSHPDLAGKAAIEGTLSDTSKREQAAAGLDRLTPDEYTAFHQYNSAYRERFGFPFVICARENTKESILTAFQARLENERRAEIETGVGEVLKILRLRLIEKFEG